MEDPCGARRECQPRGAEKVNRVDPWRSKEGMWKAFGRKPDGKIIPLTDAAPHVVPVCTEVMKRGNPASTANTRQPPKNQKMIIRPRTRLRRGVKTKPTFRGETQAAESESAQKHFPPLTNPNGGARNGRARRATNVRRPVKEGRVKRVLHTQQQEVVMDGCWR